MLIAGSPRALTVASPSDVNETQWSSGDWLNLQTNGVAASASAWTVAVAARANDDVVWERYAWANGAAYLHRQGSANNFRVRWQDTANAIRGDANGVGSIITGTLFSIFATIQIGGANKITLNGVSVWDTTVSAAAELIRGPAYINSNATVTAANLRMRGIWIGAGYLDPGVYYSAMFDGDGIPSAAMTAGSAIGGLSPQFAQAGDAAAWEALPGKSAGFDLQDV